MGDGVCAIYRGRGGGGMACWAPPLGSPMYMYTPASSIKTSLDNAQTHTRNNTIACGNLFHKHCLM